MFDLSSLTGTLKKSSNMQLAILSIRATPVDAKLPSPAEMLLGRLLATILPSRRHELDMEKHRDRMQERQAEMKDQHDQMSRRKTYHYCTQVRQSEFCITRKKCGAVERLYQSATSQEALFMRDQLRIKGQQRGEKYHKQSDYIKTRISSLDYLKLTFWQYPTIHTNYIMSHCTTLQYNHNI